MNPNVAKRNIMLFSFLKKHYEFLYSQVKYLVENQS